MNASFLIVLLSLVCIAGVSVNASSYCGLDDDISPHWTFEVTFMRSLKVCADQMWLCGEAFSGEYRVNEKTRETCRMSSRACEALSRLKYEIDDVDEDDTKTMGKLLCKYGLVFSEIYGDDRFSLISVEECEIINQDIDVDQPFSAIIT